MKIVLNIADSLFDDVMEYYQHYGSLYGVDIEIMKDYLSSKILAEMRNRGKGVTITLNSKDRRDYKIINPIIERYTRDRLESLAKLKSEVNDAYIAQDADWIERAEKAYSDLFYELPIY